MVSAAESEDADGGPFWAKPGFILAALALAAVALLGVVLAFRANGGEDEPVAEPPAATESATAADPAQTSDPAAPTSSPTAAPDPESDCPTLSGRGGEDAITTAPDVQWRPVGEVAAAFSDDNGPAERDGIKECFAQTPEGALLAAYNFLADLRVSGLDGTEVVEARMDPQAQTYNSLLESASKPPANGYQPISVVGYRFISSDESANTIALIQRIPGTTETLYAQDQLTMTWTGSDWIVSTIDDPRQVNALPPGFIQWGPDGDSPE